jgi:methionyl-tRNA formyltransferase
VGHIFINTFLENKIPIAGVVVEEKKHTHNWNRLKKKIHKDGIHTALRRIGQVYMLKITKRDIASLCWRNQIPVYSVQAFNSSPCADLLSILDADILAIASAPILKKEIFSKAKKGCLNAHPGWLPKYRGLGANAYAIQAGDSPGVTIHYVDQGIDTGKIIVRETIPIQSCDTVAKINDRATVRGAQLMAQVIQDLQNGNRIIQKIKEKKGKLYYSMPFKEVKHLNKRLRK